jgi:hypothetical protein
MQENRWTHWSNLTTSSIIANEVKGGMARWLCHLWDNLVFESPLEEKGNFLMKILILMTQQKTLHLRDGETLPSGF